jgi:5,10-methylenetetrahydrofolate reductase
VARGGAGGGGLSRPSLLEAAAAEPALTASCGPLRRADASELRAKLRALRGAFRFVKFGDNPRAIPSVSPWAAACLALAEDLEPIVHVTCRGRDRVSLQAELLGGKVLDVRHLLCLRGDDPPSGRAFREVDVLELLAMARATDEGWTLLAAADPGLEPTPEVLGRLRAKVAAGAALLETQPVFDVGAFAGWLAAVRAAGIGAPVLVDVFVLSGPEEAERVARIPGVGVPAAVRRRLREPGGGVRVAAELVGELRGLPGVIGCHLSTFRGDVDLALAVAEALR